MKIRFLGQSGYLLTSGDSSILLDPYLSDSVNRIAGRPRVHPIPLDPTQIQCDAVICTHNHADHLDPDTVSILQDRQRFITTAEGKSLLKSMGKSQVTVLLPGQSTSAGAFQITAVYACHTVEAFGVIIRAEGLTLYFSGDTLFDEQLSSIRSYHPDAAFLCINGRLGNMNPEEALTLARILNAKINIPNHYDMFLSNSEDPRKFASHIPNGKILEFNREYDLDRLLTE